METMYNFIMQLEMEKTHTITYCKTKGCNKPIVINNNKDQLIDYICHNCKRKKFNN